MAARILALVSDAYGVRGGIARYNRDLFEALAGAGAEILVLPRLGEIGALRLPAGIRQRPAIFGPLRFSLMSLWTAWRYRPVDVLFCGHVLMAPLAVVLARLLGARCWLQAHGTDVWIGRRDGVRRAIEAADQVDDREPGDAKAPSRLGRSRARAGPRPAQYRRRALRARPAVASAPRALGPRFRADPAHGRKAGGRRALQGP